MSSVCFSFFLSGMSDVCLWDMTNVAHSITRCQKTILRSTYWRRPTLDEIWTWVDKFWQMMGVLQQWWWVQVPLSPVALVPNCHASTCKHHCCKVVFARQTCMLCVKLTQFPALNSLCIVIGGIHQVFATPKRNRMLYVWETALPIQFLDHHACRF